MIRVVSYEDHNTFSFVGGYIITPSTEVAIGRKFFEISFSLLQLRRGRDGGRNRLTSNHSDILTRLRRTAIFGRQRRSLSR